MKWKKDHKIPNTKSKLTDASIAGDKLGNYEDEDDYDSEGLLEEDDVNDNNLGFQNCGRKRRSNGEIIGNNNNNELVAIGNEHLNIIRMNK
jgi:hypothetical protein